MKVTSVGINTLYGNTLSELAEQNPDILKLRLRELAKVISRWAI